MWRCKRATPKLKDMVFTIADILDKRELLRFGAIPVSDDEYGFLIGDNRKLTQNTGWAPQYTLDRGLAETIAWWQHQR